MKRFFLLMCSIIWATFTLDAQCTELFFSEYVEGSSNNKYIEVYNPTSSTVDLSNYEMRLFSNGDPKDMPTQTNTLSGMLAPGAVIVYRNSSANIYMGPTTSISTINFNGDDALALYNTSTMEIADIFGHIGCDPGTQWGTTATNETQNQTLRRNSDVTVGVSINPTGTCSPSSFPTLQTEWTELAQDDVSGLGSHTFDGCGTGPSCTITNVMITDGPSCGDVPFEDQSFFDISFDVSGGSGTQYNILNPANSVAYGVQPSTTTDGTVTSSGGASSAATPGTIAQIVVVDAGNASCMSAPIPINVPICPPPAGCDELFFSEYVEGSSNNKYVEVYNPTNSTVDLSNYEIRRYNNGAMTPSFTESLSGMLASGAVIVYSNSSAAAFGGASTDSDLTFYNGDDALELYNTSTGEAVDIFGRIGQDPGSQWGTTATNETQDQTLRRNNNVNSGNTSNATDFPSLQTEWTEYDIDDVSNLGVHAADGCAFIEPMECPTEAFISEFHYDNTGSDVNEFVEVAISNDFIGDLSNLNVILYNGSNGTSYGSATLDAFTEGANDGTYKYYTMMIGGFSVSGIQNGAPDGIALVCVETVEDFVSYEGSFTATNGPAAGATSTDVGVQETSSTPVGSSIELFEGTWTLVCQDSKGAANLGITVCCSEEDAYISEFHYDNASFDVDEFVEVAVSDDYDGAIADLSVVLYNGSGGAPYNSTITLDNFIAGDNVDGFTYYYYVYPQNGLQNGSPDGIALTCSGSLIQLLSYEGSFTATSGPAAGATSTDVGVAEGGGTEIGSSLELFEGTWIAVCEDTRGAENEGITFCCDLTIDEVQTTPDCPGVGGTMTIFASCSVCDGALKYSIDGGDSFQASNFFDGLPAGPYDVVVMDDGTTACMEMGEYFISLPGDDVPAPWIGTDVGNSGFAGNDFAYDFCEDEYSVTGGGNNAFPGTNADAVAFLNQELCGNGSIIAKLESVTPNGYGGLMIRENNTSSAKQVSMFSNLQTVIRWETRYFNGAPKSVQSFSRPFPIWLKLERVGNWFIGSYSTTGPNNFLPVHAVMVSMNSCVEIGLASFTFFPGQQTTAVFSNVSVSGGFGGFAEGVDVPEFGIETADADRQQIALFPNPATDIATITFGEERDASTVLRVRNELGQLVEEYRLDNPAIQMEVNVSNLSNGIYFVEVLTDGQIPEIIRFVKSK